MVWPVLRWTESYGSRRKYIYIPLACMTCIHLKHALSVYNMHDEIRASHESLKQFTANSLTLLVDTGLVIVQCTQYVNMFMLM